jgi:predicted nucleic acid-binding protein
MAEPSRLIETSILVDLLRGYSRAREWIDSLPQGEAAISVCCTSSFSRSGGRR